MSSVAGAGRPATGEVRPAAVVTAVGWGDTAGGRGHDRRPGREEREERRGRGGRGRGRRAAGTDIAGRRRRRQRRPISAGGARWPGSRAAVCAVAAPVSRAAPAVVVAAAGLGGEGHGRHLGWCPRGGAVAAAVEDMGAPVVTPP